MLDSSPIVPSQIPLVAGDRWGHWSHWPRAVRPAPFQGGRNSLHILEMWKMLKKTRKERDHLDHLAVVFQTKTCIWIEIDFVDTSSPTQFKNTNTVCLTSDWRHWEILQNPGQTEYFGTSLRKETKTGQKNRETMERCCSLILFSAAKQHSLKRHRFPTREESTHLQTQPNMRHHIKKNQHKAISFDNYTISSNTQI